MISVVVYTLDDANTIDWCLSSLVNQSCSCDFEVIVVDDGSSDRTPQLVADGFPDFKLVRQDKTRGWTASVREAKRLTSGEILAFLGSHCTADRSWVATIEEEMSTGFQVITGRGTHGEGRFLDRFEALSVHPAYVGRDKGEVAFVWDDNFAIQPSVLEDALPELDRYLSDGAGATLLSLELARLGIPIQYRPSLLIDHATHSLGSIVRSWHGEMAENAIAIKLGDSSLPWARLLWMGPLAAAALAAGGFLHKVGAVLRSRHDLQVSLPEAILDSCLLACMMPGYFAGLCREIARNWHRIRQVR